MGEKSSQITERRDLALGRLQASLRKSTAELASARRQLREGVAERKKTEKAYEKQKDLHNRCLEASLHLQKRLRHLTHRVLAAQEDERKKIGRELQQEIAQTLLGINAQLRFLKQEARNNSAGMKNEIAGAQRLVLKSVRSVRQAARKIGNP